VIGTIRIGHFFGIEESIHWSWIFIFFFITGTFAEGILNQSFPEWTKAQLWSVALAISIVFFLSILLHELSHSLVARRFGIPVSSITLLIYGGVSNLTREPDNYRQEFWIAIVGPLTSLAIGGLFAIGWLVLGPISDGAANVSLRLAEINAMIGVFNMIPGFPLDGGRVLRSVFWGRKKDILAATRLASAVGQVVANLIMAAGVAAFIFVDWLSGIWLFLIGNFLRTSAFASYEQLFIDRVLKGIPVTQVARHDYEPISPDETVQTLVDEHLLAGQSRVFPVMAGEQLLGLITLSDIRRVPREDWAKTTVYRAMTPVDRLKTVGPSSQLPEVLALMATGDINQVPILDGRLLQGIVHRSDVLRYIQTRQQLGAGATTH
jgi:Zn-dependent protease/CBS domain-containing protein